MTDEKEIIDNPKEDAMEQKAIKPKHIKKRKKSAPSAVRQDFAKRVASLGNKTTY